MSLPAEGPAWMRAATILVQAIATTLIWIALFRLNGYRWWGLRKAKGKLSATDVLNTSITLTGKPAVAKPALTPDFVGYRVWRLQDDELLPRNGPSAPVTAMAWANQQQFQNQQAQLAQSLGQLNAMAGQSIYQQLLGYGIPSSQASNLVWQPAPPLPPTSPVAKVVVIPEVYHPWSGPVGKAHETPTDWNESGLYSWRRDTKEGLQCFCAEIKTIGKWKVAGRIRHFGTVAEHTLGYRSSHAVFECLAIQGDDPEIIKKLGERYQCPVRGFVSAANMFHWINETGPWAFKDSQWIQREVPHAVG